MSVASGSDYIIDEDFIEDEDLFNDLTGSTLDDSAQNGYTQQLSDITTLLLFSIFALGVISGLLMAKIMWRKVIC